MYRNLSNMLPTLLYMFCGALLCMIYNEIVKEDTGQPEFLLSKDQSGACNCPIPKCPDSLHVKVESKQMVSLTENELNKEKKDSKIVVDKVSNSFEAVEDNSLSSKKAHTQELHHNVMRYFTNFSASGDTRLPTWAFNQKSIFRSYDCGTNPKIRMDGNKDKTIKKIIHSALKKSCTYARDKKKMKVCNLLHGSLNIDIEKGIRLSLILSEQNKTFLKIFGRFKLQDAFSIEKGRLVKNQQNEIHVVTMMSDSLPMTRLTDFLDMIKIIKLKQKLYVYFSLYGRVQIVRQYKNVILDASRGLKNARFRMSHVRGRFERGAARHSGVSMLPQGNVLILFVDIDISFNSGFLQRCQLYTQPKQSVYFPIVFSQYNPKFFGNTRKPWVISSNHGMWRDQGHGNLCTFKSDYLEIGGFNVNITGWGSEDDDIYQRFHAKKHLIVHRFPDHGIFHRWHKKECDVKKLDKTRYQRCLSTNLKYEASCRDLALLYFKQQNRR